MIALTDEFARSKNLRTSQRFPWDKSRGIYLINGYHKLHCLVRSSILRMGRGKGGCLSSIDESTDTIMGHTEEDPALDHGDGTRLQPNR